MTIRVGLIPAAVSACVAALLVAGAVWGGDKSHADTSGGSGPLSAVTIDSLAGETFTPVAPTVQGSLSASAAWQRFASRIGASSAIRNGVVATLGKLTLPVGPVGPDNSMAYTADGELVWAYSYDACAAGVMDGATGHPCVEWTFLDAATGEQIDTVWQH